MGTATSTLALFADKVKNGVVNMADDAGYRAGHHSQLNFVTRTLP